MHVLPGFLRLAAARLHPLRGPAGQEQALHMAKSLANEAVGRAVRLFALLFVILGGAVPAVAADDRLAAPSLATASYSPDIGIAEAAPDRWVEAAKERGGTDQADDAGALPAAVSVTAQFAAHAPLPVAVAATVSGQPARSYQARAPPIV